mmetsp:Transcript_12060/g.28604  ORF Transcript_12060/g.28604 Transcript_12060/m.28604 type:complete len:267 (+) Transcript_12060:461-1261(+)
MAQHSSIHALLSVLLDHATAEALACLIKGSILPASKTLIVAVQLHQDAPGPIVLKLAVVRLGPMAHLALNGSVLRVRTGAADPVDPAAREAPAHLLVRVVMLRGVHDVHVDVLPNDIPRPVREQQARALADGVEPEAPVEAELPPGLLLDDEARPLAEVLPDKLAEPHLAEEADPLAVLPPLSREPRGPRHRPHLGLGERPEGEHRPRELLLAKLSKEVGLVLDGVGCRPELDGRAAAAAAFVPWSAEPRVVSRGYTVKLPRALGL